MGHFPPKGRHPLLHTAVAVFCQKEVNLGLASEARACNLAAARAGMHARLLLVPWPFSAASARAAAAEIKDFPQTEVNRGWGKFSGERPLLGPKALPLPPLLRACARVFC